MIEKLIAELKLDLAIIAELVLGFLFWLLLLGLLPKDTLNFNVLGSVVLWAVIAVVFGSMVHRLLEDSSLRESYVSA